MLIGFIGCPSSGKTTTAAMTFADLKELGFTAEFIPEQARFYIAELRFHLRLSPKESLKLDDRDQESILVKQMEIENIYLEACGPEVVIVTDSCVLNTLLYLSSSEYKNNPELDRMMLSHLSKYDLLFYSHPVVRSDVNDPNRVHSQEQSLEIDKKIPFLLKMYGVNPVELKGDSKTRHNEVTREILRRLAE